MRFLSSLTASVLGTFLALGLLLFIGFAVMTALVVGSDVEPTVQQGSVLVVTISGSIPEIVGYDPFEAAFFGQPTTDLYDLKQSLKKAAVDNRIDGVWLKMQGVSAGWGTLQEIRDALLSYKESGKPLIASSGEYLMTERDYFLASTADRVFASPEAFFEFNGLYLEVLFYKGLLDELDVDAEIIRAGNYKAAVEPFLRNDMSAENEAQLNALLQASNTRFVHGIAESREQSVENIEQLLQKDAILTAVDAHKAGLLDGLLFEDEVEADLKTQLGVDEDKDLRRISHGAYAQTPGSKAGLKTGNDGHIAVVYAVGTILSGSSAGRGGIVGSATFNKAMRTARTDDHVKAVVLRINSPGGSASASDAMWREIHLTSQKKPVIVSMGDLAASGGYWIATAANSIVANPQTITGSIGVFGVFFQIGSMLENKLGITSDRVMTGPYADMFSLMRPMETHEHALLERAVSSTYDAFLQKVADSRKMERNEVHRIGQGRIWTGADAMELGLVDALGSLDTAIAIAADKAGLEEGSYSIRRLPTPPTIFDELNDALLLQAQRALRLAGILPESASILQHPANILQEITHMHGTAQARMQLDITIR